MNTYDALIHAQGGGGYGPPPGGYGPPGAPPGGAPPGAPPGGGYPPPGGYPPGGYQPPPGYPPHGAPMAPPGGGPMMGGAPGGPNAELKKQSQTWLIISIVSFLFCGSGCFGMIAAIMAYLAGQAVDQGNIPDAESKLKWSKILTIVGVVLFLLLIVAYVLAVFVFGLIGNF